MHGQQNIKILGGIYWEKKRNKQKKKRREKTVQENFENLLSLC